MCILSQHLVTSWAVVKWSEISICMTADIALPSRSSTVCLKWSINSLKSPTWFNGKKEEKWGTIEGASTNSKRSLLGQEASYQILLLFKFQWVLKINMWTYFCDKIQQTMTKRKKISNWYIKNLSLRELNLQFKDRKKLYTKCLSKVQFGHWNIDQKNKWLDHFSSQKRTLY